MLILYCLNLTYLSTCLCIFTGAYLPLSAYYSPCPVLAARPRAVLREAARRMLGHAMVRVVPVLEDVRTRRTGGEAPGLPEEVRHSVMPPHPGRDAGMLGRRDQLRGGPLPKRLHR